MYSNWFLKSFRILLLPFALMYWVIIWVRNKMYDKDILLSTTFGLPVICVGNLSVGGTGKSPMVELLVSNLKDHFKIAVLSRGYKRKTKGYTMADDDSTALEIGDEPMQFHLKFPDIPVAVGEKRLEAIPQLLQDKPATEVIILDDAFQHRAVKAGLNILLTEYDNLFTRDFFLPTGDLRDLKSSYKRAEIIVVTKCKPDLSEEEKLKIMEEINPVKGQQIFFSYIQYGQPYHITNKVLYNFKKQTEVLLVTGIANSKPLEKLILEQCNTYEKLNYPDHHVFIIDDLKEMLIQFKQMDSDNKIILTTEKDAMRLLKFRQEIEVIPLYVIPIRHHFMFNEANRFNEIVVNFINNFKAGSHN